MEVADMNHVKEERSLGALFSDLSQEMQRLVRDEIALLKSEMSHKISIGLKAFSFLAIGGVVLFAGVLALISTVILALAAVMTAWVAALIVSVVVLGTGYFLLQRGLTGLRQTDFSPRETISTLKGDKEWLKKQT
jgi:hypothetical protein